jgi:hypothetical protein
LASGSRITKTSRAPDFADGHFWGIGVGLHYLEGAYFETYLQGNHKSLYEGKLKANEYQDPLEILGLRRSLDIDERIRKGFPFRSYELFRKQSLFTVMEMRRILQVSPVTLSKCRKPGRLTGLISDRLYRTSVAFYFVNLMVGYDSPYAQEWFHEATPWLNGCRPIDLLQTDPDTDEVIAATCRVLDGMVA